MMQRGQSAIPYDSRVPRYLKFIINPLETCFATSSQRFIRETFILASAAPESETSMLLPVSITAEALPSFQDSDAIDSVIRSDDCRPFT